MNSDTSKVVITPVLITNSMPERRLRAACTVSQWLPKKAGPSAATTLLSHVACAIAFDEAYG